MGSHHTCSFTDWLTTGIGKGRYNSDCYAIKISGEKVRLVRPTFTASSPESRLYSAVDGDDRNAAPVDIQNVHEKQSAEGEFSKSERADVWMNYLFSCLWIYDRMMFEKAFRCNIERMHRRTIRRTNKCSSWFIIWTIFILHFIELINKNRKFLHEKRWLWILDKV